MESHKIPWFQTTNQLTVVPNTPLLPGVNTRPSVVSVPQVEVFMARPTCPETSLGSGVTSFPQEKWAKSGEITEITMENLGMAPNIAKMGEKNREKKT